MGRSKDLSQRVVNSIQSRITQIEIDIARSLGLNRLTVCAVIKRFTEKRKKKLSMQDKRSVLRLVKTHGVQPLRDITQNFDLFR